MKNWWFYLFITILFFIPAYTQVPYNNDSISLLREQLLDRDLPFFFLLFEVLLICILIIGYYRSKGIFVRVVSMLLVLIALIFSVAQTNGFGFVFLVGDFLIVSIISLKWFFESYDNRKIEIHHSLKIGLIIGACIIYIILASRVGFITNFKELFIINFLVIFPVMIGNSILSYGLIEIDKGNLLQRGAGMGIVLGLFSIVSWFDDQPKLWYVLLIHSLLFVISIYVFIRLRKKV